MKVFTYNDWEREFLILEEKIRKLGDAFPSSSSPHSYGTIAATPRSKKKKQDVIFPRERINSPEADAWMELQVAKYPSGD